MKKHILYSVAYLSSFAVSGLLAQEVTPTPGPPVVTISDVKTQSATPPGSSGQWIKILVDFKTTLQWTDGVQFVMTALVGDGTKERPYSILAGDILYINVPQGSHTAALFVSPKTSARYGGVGAVSVRAYYDDTVVANVDKVFPGKEPPANWGGIFDRREGALLPIMATPWVVTEYDRYPDAIFRR